MPYVNIRITEERVTEEKKKTIVAGVTTLLQEVLGKNPKTTMVIIDEIPMENIGLGGVGVLEFRKHHLDN